MCDELRWFVILLSIYVHLVACLGCANLVKFILYISLVLYASISTCRGNSVKISKFIYKCALGIHSNLYAHIKGEFSLLIEFR